LVGESDVGKTTLIKMFLNGQVDSLKKDWTDVCNDFQTVIPIEMENGQKNRVKSSLWDTAGTEEFKSIAGMYYRDAHAAIIVYSIDNKHSFEKVNYWESQVNDYCPPGILKVLVGNKSDMENDRKVKPEDGQERASDSMLFYETSAQTSYESV